MEKPPEIIYKYRDWEDVNHQKLLKERELYFSSCEYFNDSNDLRIPYAMNYEIICSICKKNNIPKPNKKDAPGVIAKFQQQQQLRRNKTGVVSLSANYNIDLMWNKYANNHKGFCVGFNTYKLIQAIPEECSLLPVSYSPDQPICNCYDDNEQAVLPLITKSLDWEYEDEYRLIFLDQAGYKFKVDNSIISEIYLGAKMSDKHCSEITNFISENLNHVKVYKENLNNDSFDLTFHPME